MPRTSSDSIENDMPVTIAGLWGLCALMPLRSRRAYQEAAALCNRLAVRRLNAAQREYFRELLDLVKAFEDEHDEHGKSLEDLRRLAARG